MEGLEVVRKPDRVTDVRTAALLVRTDQFALQDPRAEAPSPTASTEPLKQSPLPASTTSPVHPQLGRPNCSNLPTSRQAVAPMYASLTRIKARSRNEIHGLHPSADPGCRMSKAARYGVR